MRLSGEFFFTTQSGFDNSRSIVLVVVSCGPFHQYISAFLAEPSFVFADVIREGTSRVDGEDDKIYYFFTEVSVEYEFFGKLLIPRVARVCKVSARHVPSAHTSSHPSLARMFLLSVFTCLSPSRVLFLPPCINLYLSS